MKNKLKMLALVFSMAFLLTSCQVPGMFKKGTSGLTKSVSANAKETIMVYMVGSNLESQAGLASLDIKEMVDSQFDTNNMTVLVCTGGSKQWIINGIPNDKCMVYKVDNDKIEPVYTMQGTNMAESATLTEFLDYGYDNYKADYYGLTLWNHGGGAIVGYGADENYDYDSLSINELDTSLSSSKLCKDGKFEWVGFDACLMGMIEVANMLEPYANYMIASEEVESGQGWDYAFLGDVSKDKLFNGDDTAKSIIDKYSDYFENTSTYKIEYTLSCLDLSKTKDTISSLEKFVTAAEEELKNGEYSKLAQARDATKDFGKVSDTSFYDTVDIYNLTEKMQKFYPNESSDLQKAIKEMVVYNKANIANANGLAIYFPYSNKEQSKNWLEIYNGFNFSKTYSTFINDFTNTLSGNVITSWNVEQTTPTQDTSEKGTYFVQLSDAEAKNYAHAKVQIWGKEDNGTYISWTQSTNLTLSEDGKLRTEFDKKIFYLEDASGNSVPCVALETERNEEYSTYYSPVMLEHSDDLSSEVVEVHFKVDSENNMEVIGVYGKMETGDSLFPERYEVEVKDGDYITPFLFARDIVFNADGSVAPFDSWKSASGGGKGFKASGKLSVKSKTLDDTQYCCLFKITDTQGNTYFSNPIMINQ